MIPEDKVIELARESGASYFGGSTDIELRIIFTDKSLRKFANAIAEYVIEGGLKQTMINNFEKRLRNLEKDSHPPIDHEAVFQQIVKEQLAIRTRGKAD